MPGDPKEKAAIKIIQIFNRSEAYLAGLGGEQRPLSHLHLMRLFHAGHCQIDDDVQPLRRDGICERTLLRSSRASAHAHRGQRNARPVLDALSYLHERDCARCLKPSNIMVVENQLKLSVDSIEVAGKLAKPSTSVFMTLRNALPRYFSDHRHLVARHNLGGSLTQSPKLGRIKTTNGSCQNPFRTLLCNGDECLRSRPWPMHPSAISRSI